MLRIFNPENDQALSHESPYFTPPPASKKMAEDLRLLPLWWSDSGDWLLWNENIDFIPYREQIAPWGWSLYLAKRLERLGFSPRQMPSDLDAIRLLSHRRTASLLQELLLKDERITLRMPEPAQEITSLSELTSKDISSILFKQPWSSSGKGLCWGNTASENVLLKWADNTIRKMGCVMAEQICDKVADFAMAFYAEPDKRVTFRGYSFFEVDEYGCYRGNLLASDRHIETLLGEYVAPGHLQILQKVVAEKLSAMIDGRYEGYLGVDMLIYKKDSDFFINPCVEVNLRMTMGIASRLIYDRYICQGEGRFVVCHCSRPGEMLEMHLALKNKYPLVLTDGHIVSGYHALTPVRHQTQYLAYLIMNQ